LTRYHRNHEPYSIPFCTIPDSANQQRTELGALFNRLRQILTESEATTSTKDMDAKEFWIKRRTLDKEMEVT
jgi:hypothetical protein